jgi:hypothetical protein
LPQPNYPKPLRVKFNVAEREFCNAGTTVHNASAKGTHGVTRPRYRLRRNPFVVIGMDFAPTSPQEPQVPLAASGRAFFGDAENHVVHRAFARSNLSLG